jgi:hypothetical protein
MNQPETINHTFTDAELERVFEIREISHVVSTFEQSSEATTRCLATLTILIAKLDETIRKLQL